MSGFENDVVFAKNADFTQSDNQSPAEANGLFTNGQLWIGRTAVNAGGTHIDVNTLTSGTGITITNGPGTINIASTASLTDLHVARFIVASSTSGTGANFTTIASAITAAVATGINSTIFLQPGTYTENFILPPNINLCAFDCDALTPNVTISGTVTMTAAGTSSISGIRLQTNSAALLAITGTLASIVNLSNCYLNCTNSTGITFSTNSASAQINIINCNGNVGTTGIAVFAHSSAGTLNIRFSNLTNSGASTTANTCSAGVLNISKSSFNTPLTMSSTAACTIDDTLFATAGTNTTSATLDSGGIQSFRYCRFSSGSASAVSIGGTAVLDICEIDSTNTNAVTGAGVLTGNTQTFTNSSTLVNTTTRTPQVFGLTGQFTPTVALGTPGTSSFTYSQQVGHYNIIGSLVFITIRIVLTNFTVGTGSGQVAIGTLPFAAAATSNQSTALSCVVQNVTFGVGVTYYQGQIQASGTTIIVAGSVTAANQVNLQAAGLSSTSTFLISGCYSTT